MVKLVAEHGTRFWALIGAKLNGRTGKQVHLFCLFLKYLFNLILLCSLHSVVKGGTIN